MNKILFFIIAAIIGYLFGSIPTGFLYAKSKGKNIYSEGSHSPGATNIHRTLGSKSGKIVFLLDTLKTVIPIIIMDLVYVKFVSTNTFGGFFTSDELGFELRTIALYVGLFTILGHDYPITMGFNGGKGISCTFGMLIMFSPVIAIFLLILQRFISKITKYVSLGSILVLSIFFLFSIIFSALKIYPFEFGFKFDVIILVFLIAALGIYRHKTNIERLLNGTENKITK